MYDFYFGNKEAIDRNPGDWLLNIKRMLPRWPNGIPDSEYLALYECLRDLEADGRHQGGVLIETGSGASTVVLLYFAIKWQTELYTWDISGNKLAYLRGVVADTLFRHFSDRNLFRHWKYVAYDSTEPHVGIPILGELEKKVTAAFFDSDHTWRTLGAEVEAVSAFLADGALVSIDDGNYRYRNVNTAYINMLRTKLGLAPVEIVNNTGDSFGQEVFRLLQGKFPRVVDLEGGYYRQNFREDLFWAYFQGDRRNMADLDMEKMDDLACRFEAWRVYRQ